VLKHKGYVTIASLLLTYKTSYSPLNSIVATQVIVCVCVIIPARTPKSPILFKKTVKIFQNYGSNIYTDVGDNCALETQQTN
jgi:hypothetical protein